MRALPLNSTLIVFAILLVWSLIRAAGFGSRGAQATWELLGRALSHRAVLPFLVLGACANVSFSALAGYINPRDYVQDVVAAHQFLKHATMYPPDLPRMGIVELSAPIRGREELRRLPVIRRELNTLTDPPASANAHPPALGIALAPPVFLFGLRGSFVFVLLLSVVLVYVSVAAILHELFPPLPFVELCAVMGLVFGWYPVGTTFRSGQPSIVLFALITASWLMLRRNRPWIAGGAIGLATCLHAFPALLVLYFAIRSRRAFVSAVGTITLLSVAAAAVTIQHTFNQWLNTVDMIAQRFVPRAGNLSLAGLITSFSGGIGWGENVKIIAPAMVLIIAAALAIFLWPWNRGNVRPERLDVEYSVFVAAMLLASPISWGRYLPIMLLPLGVIIRNWRQKRPAWAVQALLAALFFTSFPDSTLGWLYNWLTGNLGFAAGWLSTAMPSFSILAILLWLGFSVHGAAGADPADVKAVQASR
jgi:general stress protein CsbA